MSYSICNDKICNFPAGYEIIGLERIPNTGPALMIYYHGAIPIDFYYIMAKVILYKSRMIRAVGDRFLFKTPGMKEIQFCSLKNVYRCYRGSISTNPLIGD